MNAPVRTLDIDRLKTWEGREETVRDMIDLPTLSRVRAFFGRKPQVSAGEALPETWHWFFFHPATGPEDLGPDGHPRTGGFLPPFDLPRRMWGGSRLQFEAPLRAGEVAERSSRVVSVDLKSGRSGKLGLVKVEHVISQHGATCRREVQDIVYREAATGPQPVPNGPAASGRPLQSQLVTPDTVTLFRFSALTWNAHRIHYDRDYAMDEEGYPGLVVHGPLTASLLALFSREGRDGAPMTEFTFRGTSPLFDGTPFGLNVMRDGGQDTLWAAREGAGMSMTAEATY